MRFREMIDHKLREYNYKRKRSNPNYKNNSDFDIEEFLNEADAYVGELVEEIDRFLPKNRRR